MWPEVSRRGVRPTHRTACVALSAVLLRWSSKNNYIVMFGVVLLSVGPVFS